MKGLKIFFLVLVFAAVALAAGAALGLDFIDFRQANIHFVVAGNSMEPILTAGQELKVDTKYYKVAGIKEGDIIVYQYSESRRPIAKSVKAIPGDSFYLEQTPDNQFHLIVNGSVVTNSENEPYIFSGNRAKMISLYVDQYNQVIPDDRYLILGNNVKGSFDSTKIGLVGGAGIVGRVEL